MFKLKKSKFIWLGIIFMGVMLVGLQTSFAADPDAQGGTTETATAEPTMVDGYIQELAEFWAAESDESAESLEVTFGNISMDKLIAVSEASSFSEVLETLGDTGRDYVYTPVTPCRIIDTQGGGGGGRLFPGQVRSYYVWGGGGLIGPQGGNGSGCPSPRGEPRAVHINLVAAQPGGQGNLKAFPKGGSATSGIGVNFGLIGTNLNTVGPTKTSYNTGTEISLGTNFASSHAVVHVLGYYHEVSRDDADRLALAFGVISSSGGRLSGTENWSSSYNSSSQRYEITISGHSYSDSGYTTVVTPVNFSPCADNVARTDSGSGRLFVSFWDVEGTDVATDQQCQFSFLTFRDQ